jgi:hypothetical protein
VKIVRWTTTVPPFIPKHLSWFERFVLRKGRFYDAELDCKQKVEE